MAVKSANFRLFQNVLSSYIHPKQITSNTEAIQLFRDSGTRFFDFYLLCHGYQNANKCIAIANLTLTGHDLYYYHDTKRS